MIKIIRILDIGKVLESHTNIVHDEPRFLNTTLKSVFSGSDLVDWLLKHYNPVNSSREELTKLVHEELYDPTLPNQAIYPVLHEAGFLDSKKHLYRFPNDQYVEYKKDSYVINLHGLETAHYHYFYESNGEASIFDLIKEFNEVVTSIYKDYVEEDGSAVNYEEIMESELFNKTYLTLVTRLAFTDISPIIGNDEFVKTFFINLYNIFAIHILINKFFVKKKWGMNMVERLDSFNTYKYNISGHNYSLNDIHHGILRKNDPAAGNIATVVMQMVIDKKSKNCRFTESDPRFKFIVRSFDPRVNFALNYGAISCPNLRFYHDDKIDEQLNKAAEAYCTKEVELTEVKGKMRIEINQLFKYYAADFGNNIREVLEYTLNYNQNDKYAKAIKNLFDQKNLPLDYKKFNLDINIKKAAVQN